MTWSYYETWLRCRVERVFLVATAARDIIVHHPERGTERKPDILEPNDVMRVMHLPVDSGGVSNIVDDANTFLGA